MFHVKLGKVLPAPHEAKGSVQEVLTASVVGEFDTEEAAMVLVNELVETLQLGEVDVGWWARPEFAAVDGPWDWSGPQLAVWLEQSTGG